MAVAKDQIDELYSIISDYVDEAQQRNMYIRLMKTQAYHRNPSFATTIDRLYEKVRRPKDHDKHTR